MLDALPSFSDNSSVAKLPCPSAEDVSQQHSNLLRRRQRRNVVKPRESSSGPKMEIERLAVREEGRGANVMPRSNIFAEEENGREQQMMGYGLWGWNPGIMTCGF